VISRKERKGRKAGATGRSPLQKELENVYLLLHF
jgi:hypothetical protein